MARHKKLTMIEDTSPYEIIARFQQAPGSPPVHVDEIVRALGINLYKVDLGPTISGQLMRDRVRGGSSGFAILINLKDPLTRQRFTTAHEIAHYVLHRDLIDMGVTDDTMYRSAELNSFLEVQANKMAADILMPIRLVKNAAKVENSLTALARRFGVSKQSLQIRASEIGLKLSP